MSTRDELEERVRELVAERDEETERAIKWENDATIAWASVTRAEELLDECVVSDQYHTNQRDRAIAIITDLAAGPGRARAALDIHVGSQERADIASDDLKVVYRYLDKIDAALYDSQHPATPQPPTAPRNENEERVAFYAEQSPQVCPDWQPREQDDLCARGGYAPCDGNPAECKFCPTCGSMNPRVSSNATPFTKIFTPCFHPLHDTPPTSELPEEESR